MMTPPVPAYSLGDARYARGWMVPNNGAPAPGGTTVASPEPPPSLSAL
ncbi:MAG TPA: hypothetical protein VK813_12065 [Edaphobacter sp.]|nr:hypothetical protein [Edaphobacter sp.]